jgi:hypothetical protein
MDVRDELLECSRTLNERMSGQILNTTDYQKFGRRSWGEITGTAFRHTGVHFLVVVDVNIHRNLSEAMRTQIRDNLARPLRGAGGRLVRSAHGGLHIYCNQGVFPLWANRAIKCWSGPDFDIDLFGAIDPAHQGIVLLPGAMVKDAGNELTLTYELIEDPEDGVVRLTLPEVLERIGVKIDVPVAVATKKKR